MFPRFLKILALVAALFAISAEAAFAEKRVALVIGNSAYQKVTQLPNPAKDAASVAAMLKKAGFDVVESKRDLTNIELRRALRHFTRIALHADIAVVYYAGHGLEFDGVNYLIPVDAQLASDVDVEDETVSLDRIMRMLEPVKRLRLVILDACRDNPFAQKMVRTIASRSVGRGLAKVDVTTTDTLVAFAAKAGMTAADGDSDHSPFTTALLDNLAVPGLDLRLALGRVRDEVMKETANKQEPYVYGSLGGSTVALVPKPKAPPPAAKPVVSSSNALARDYAFAERIGTLEAWDSFLAVHGTGFYANLARAARDKIVKARQQKKVAALPTQKTTIVATAPAAPAVAPNRNSTSVIDPGDVARLLQLYLKRVGCDPGALDGQWTEQSVHAMQEFNKRTKANFDVKLASIGALDAVKQHKARVCPLVCGKGYKAEDDRCVAVACRRGYVRNNSGDCEREAKRAATRTAPRKQDGGGGQIACGDRRLQDGPKNAKSCH